MQMAATTGANTAAQQAELNKQQADAASRAAVAEGIGDVGGAAAGGISSGQTARLGRMDEMEEMESLKIKKLDTGIDDDQLEYATYPGDDG